MNTKDMELFLKVADYKNLTKVAEEYNMTQPAVSAVIKRLEDSVGAPLFMRRENRLVLNEVGKQFYQVASSVCVSLNHVSQSLQTGYSNQTELVIAISVHSSRLTHLLESFAISNEDISITLRSVSESASGMRFDPADFMVMFQNDIQHEECLPIDAQASLYAIVPMNNPLSFKASLSMEERWLN